MAKTQTPFFSLGARGTVGEAITAQKLANVTVLRGKPLPTDPESPKQLWHRYLYRQACQYWHTLTAAQQQTWQSAGVPYHLTGFQFFIRTELRKLPNLICALPMDETAGPYAYDQSGNLNSGLIIGASPTPGVINNALHFDGLDDTLRIYYSPTLNITGAITIELWFQLHAFVADWRPIFHKGTIAWLAPFHIWWLTIFNQTVYFGFNPVGSTSLAAAITLLDTWYLLQLIYDLSTVTLYINDTLAKSVPAAGAITSLPTNLNLARFSNMGNYTHMTADELRVYDYALTSSERTMHFERRLSP